MSTEGTQRSYHYRNIIFRIGFICILVGSEYLHAGGCKGFFLMGGDVVLFGKRSIDISSKGAAAEFKVAESRMKMKMAERFPDVPVPNCMSQGLMSQQKASSLFVCFVCYVNHVHVTQSRLLTMLLTKYFHNCQRHVSQQTASHFPNNSKITKKKNN